MPSGAARRTLLMGLLVLGGFASTQRATAAPPADWILGSPASSQGSWSYVARVDHTKAYNGSGSALLESRPRPRSRFGTLMQKLSGPVFAGRKIRFSAYLEAKNVRKRAGLWIRAEDQSGRVIAFQNISSPRASVRGTTGWTRVDILINIPRTTSALFYGVLLVGPGAVWIDDVRFVVLGKADPDAPGPGFAAYNPPPVLSRLLPRPKNLNFEK